MWLKDPTVKSTLNVRTGPRLLENHWIEDLLTKMLDIVYDNTPEGSEIMNMHIPWN